MSHRVLVADANPIIHVGVEQMLAGTKFSVVGTASTLAQAAARLAADHFDLIVTEFEFPDGECFDLFAPDKNQVPTVIFTGFENPIYVAAAVESGMQGMIMKHETPEVFVAALRRVVNGERIWKRRELRQLTGALATPRLKSKIDFPLTRREYEVLIGVSQGMTNKKIADELQISYETVKEHVQHILRKLGVADRTQAAVLAVRKGIL